MRTALERNVVVGSGRCGLVFWILLLGVRGWVVGLLLLGWLCALSALFFGAGLGETYALGDDDEFAAFLAVVLLPALLFESAFDEDGFAFGEEPLDEFGLFIPGGYVDERCLVDVLGGITRVFASSVDGDRGVGDDSAGRELAGFGIAGEASDYQDFVEFEHGCLIPFLSVVCVMRVFTERVIMVLDRTHASRGGDRP